MSTTTFSIASTIEANKAVQASTDKRPIKSTIKAIASGTVELSQSFRLVAKTINEELRTNLMDTMIDNIVDMQASATKHNIDINELQALRASL